MRTKRLVIAGVLLLLALAVALLAADLRHTASAVQAGDLQFAESPAAASWSASTLLPGDPAKTILGISSQLAYRKAAQSYTHVSTEPINGFDNGVQEGQDRSNLESILAVLAAGSSTTRDALAENMIGVLAYRDSQEIGVSEVTGQDRSLEGFQAAAQLDPENEDAKFNLELLLQKLARQPGGVQKVVSNGFGSSKSHKGGSAVLPGHGY